MLSVFLHQILPILEWSLMSDFTIFLCTFIIKISLNVLKLLKVDLNLWFLILKVDLLFINWILCTKGSYLVNLKKLTWTKMLLLLIENVINKSLACCIWMVNISYILIIRHNLLDDTNFTSYAMLIIFFKYFFRIFT